MDLEFTSIFYSLGKIFITTILMEPESCIVLKWKIMKTRSSKSLFFLNLGNNKRGVIGIVLVSFLDVN